MTLTTNEITDIWLDPEKTYIVHENQENHVCKVFFQTKHCFFFIDDKKQRIISKTKVEYYLNHSCIKEKKENEKKSKYI